MPDRLTRVLPIDPLSPDPVVLREAADVLRAGGLVAFPTETVYGLGANALDAAAVASIFIAKGRPSNNPVIVHVDGERMLREVVAFLPRHAAALAARFWPGPLTLVMPKAFAVPNVVTGGGPTVAVRMPAHPVALGLIGAAGTPLAAPSANQSSQLSPTLATHVLAGLNGRIDMILDGGLTRSGIESTVIDLTGERAVLLRPGPIALAELEGVIGPIGRRELVKGGAALPSPGMLARHYAPRTPVELLPNRGALLHRLEKVQNLGEAVACLVVGNADGTSGMFTAMPRDAMSYAARLYAVLHELDGLGLAHILIEMPPDTDEWLAVRDRLTRSAAS